MINPKLKSDNKLPAAGKAGCFLHILRKNDISYQNKKLYKNSTLSTNKNSKTTNLQEKEIKLAFLAFEY